MIPKQFFLTKGVGVHKDRLASFEMALRKGGIEKSNLVQISSILPPGCRELSSREGSKLLQPGQIVFVVLARNDTNEPDRLLTSAIGVAKPALKKGYGYLSEHHAYGEKAKQSGEYAEDLAATMLATTLGIEFDPEVAWDERKQIYRASGKIITTSAICQGAQGDKGGLWTTTIAAAVFVM